MTTIRAARPGDLARVVALEQESYPPAEAATADMLAMRLAAAGEAFLVAIDESSGDVIGFCCGTRSPGATLTHDSMRRHDAMGESLCVHSVVVTADARRRGVGSALVRAIVARARELPGVRRVLLICKEPLIPLYGAAGFRLIGPSDVTVGADPWFAMAFELDRPRP